MKKPFYCTYGEIWDPYLTTQERIEAMEREIQGLEDQLKWSLDHAARLQKAILEKKEALDLEVSNKLRSQ